MVKYGENLKIVKNSKNGNKIHNMFIEKILKNLEIWWKSWKILKNGEEVVKWPKKIKNYKIFAKCWNVLKMLK